MSVIQPMEKRNKQIIKYSILIFIVGLVLYNSVFFEKLDTIKKVLALQNFDSKAYVHQFWHERLPAALAQSTPVADVLSGFKTDIIQTGRKYGRTLGLASTYFFLVHGEGKILEITDEGIILSLFSKQNNPDVIITTRYIFGNAIRDASGLIDVSDFPSSMEFNNISRDINNLVTTEVIPSFNTFVRAGDTLFFHGATEVNKDEPELNPLKIIPVEVKIGE